MASAAECERAFAALADRLAAVDPATRKRNSLDRSLSCTLTDLDLVFAAHLKDGKLEDIHRAEVADGQVKLAMTSDQLVALVDGSDTFASAWAARRVKLDARVTDLLKLRSIF